MCIRLRRRGLHRWMPWRIRNLQIQRWPLRNWLALRYLWEPLVRTRVLRLKFLVLLIILFRTCTYGSGKRVLEQNCLYENRCSFPVHSSTFGKYLNVGITWLFLWLMLGLNCAELGSTLSMQNTYAASRKSSYLWLNCSINIILLNQLTLFSLCDNPPPPSIFFD